VVLSIFNDDLIWVALGKPPVELGNIFNLSYLKI